MGAFWSVYIGSDYYLNQCSQRSMSPYDVNSPVYTYVSGQWPIYALRLDNELSASCHAVVTVCEPDWKHKWAAYKSFDETNSFNNL